jgi:hypothetical protein
VLIGQTREVIAVREELEGVLERALGMALNLIAKHGDHTMPFCLVVSPSGERYYVTAAHFDEEGTIEDALPPAEEALASIRHQVAQMVGEGRARAVALAVNVKCRLSDGSGEHAAVKVTLDHEEAEGFTRYALYRPKGDGGIEVTEQIEMPPAEKFFGDNP